MCNSINTNCAGSSFKRFFYGLFNRFDSGPTNIATISVAIKQIGKKSTIIYVLTIIICSITSGLLFDFIFPNLTVEKSLSASVHMLPRSEVISGYILVLILLNSILKLFSKSNIVANNPTQSLE